MVENNQKPHIGKINLNLIEKPHTTIEVSFNALVALVGMNPNFTLQRGPQEVLTDVILSMNRYVYGPTDVDFTTKGSVIIEKELYGNFAKINRIPTRIKLH